MLNRETRSVRHTLTAATLTGLSAAGLTPALVTAGQGDEGDPAATRSKGTPATLPVQRMLQDASDALSRSQPVRAKALLTSLTQNAAAMSDTEKEWARTLLLAADKAILASDPVSIILQNTELALEQDDVALALRNAKGIAQSTEATPEQAKAGRELLDKASLRQAQVQQMLPDVLRAITEDFDAGKYTQVKDSLDAVRRWGVTLSESDRALVDRYQTRIVQLEQSRGELFRRDVVAAGMMQPGEVKLRKPELPAQPPAMAEPEAPAPAPAPAEPAPEPEAPTRVVAAQPAPTSQSSEEIVQAARRFEAQELLAQADQAFEQQRLNEAQTKYARLTGPLKEYLTAEQLKHAADRLAEARLKLGANPGRGGDTLNRFVGDIAQVKQQATAEFTNDVSQAEQALQSGDVARARELAALARFRLNNARSAFSETELQDRNKQVADLQTKIATREQEIATAEATARDERLQEEARRSQQQSAEAKQAKINESIDRVRALQLERKYDEALQVVDQILYLEPNHPTGLLLRDVISDARVYSTYWKTQDAKNRSVAADLLHGQDMLIMPETEISYPADWPAISSRRGEPVLFSETPETRRTLAALEKNRLPSVNFSDNGLENIITYLANVTSLNFDVDWPALEAIGVNRDTAVSLNLTNQTVRSVLDRVLEKSSPGLDISSRAGWAVSDTGIVQISSEQVLRKQTTMVVYDVRDLLIEIRDKNNAPEFDLAAGGEGGGNSGISGGQDNEQFIDTQPKTLEERTRDLIGIITEQVDRDGWRDNGGDTSFIQQLSGNMIITTTPKNHRAIESLLGQLRKVRNMQISTESRFLLVQQNFFEEIGFDLDLYFNSDSQWFQNLKFWYPGLRPSDVSPGGNFGPSVFNPQGLPNIFDVTPATPDGIPDIPYSPLFPFDTTSYGRPSTVYTNPKGWSPISSQAGSSAIASGLLTSGFATAVRGAGTGLTVAGSFLDDIQVDFLLTATQADQRNVTLTSPRLTFTNGQRAYVAVTTDQRYVSNLTAVTGTNSVGFNPQTDVLQTGMSFEVAGTISADRRYVTLDINTGLSQLVELRGIPVTAAVSGAIQTTSGVAPPQPITGFFEAPEVERTKVETTVTVPDQGTILLGGQRIITEAEVEAGVPVLSKIPIINRFFTNRSEVKEEKSLLILIKPTILIQNEEEERHFPGLLDSLRSGLAN